MKRNNKLLSFSHRAKRILTVVERKYTPDMTWQICLNITSKKFIFKFWLCAKNLKIQTQFKGTVIQFKQVWITDRFNVNKKS